MKIAIIADEFAPGSAPKLLGLKAKYLEELGNQVTLLIINDNGLYAKNKENYDQYLKNAKIKYLINKFPKIFQKFNFKFPFMSFFSLHHLSSLFFAHRSVEYKEFDICIACCQYSTFAARNIMKKKNINYLLLIWDPSTFIAKKIYRPKYPFLFPFIYVAAFFLDKYATRHALAYITSSLFHHEKYKKIRNLPLEVIHLGCFPQKKFIMKDIKNKNILSFDRWDLGNNPKQLLDILVSLKDKSVKLLIGGYWYDEKLKQVFDDYAIFLNIEDRVQHLGYLNEEQIKYYSNLSMINIHHIHDAFATTILESSAYSCPGIVPRGCGVDEIFEEDKSILLVNDTKTETFVKKLNDFFNLNEKSINEFAFRAHELAKNNSWKNNYGLKLNKILKNYTN